MHYERLLMEPSEDGWIRFICPNRVWAGESASDLLKLPRGFNDQMILKALPATGWVREHDGQWSIESSRTCRELVQLIDEMLSYFYGPNEPSPEILGIKTEVDALIADDPELADGIDLSLWHYARLDLLVREDLAETVRTLDGIWEQDVHRLDIGQIRTQAIRNYHRDLQAQRDIPIGQMTASARMPAKAQNPGRNVG